MSSAQPTQPGARERPTYENDRYWNQRLEKDFSLAGVGHAGVGLAFNRWAYRLRRRVLLRTLRQSGIQIQGARILELGFGTGFYLDLWRQLGADFVAGFDITDIAVKAARARFPAEWRFDKADIAQPLPGEIARGSFDLATAFDVLFHLVDDAGWNGALDNIASALKSGGHAIVFDKCQSVESAVGHVRRRTLQNYTQALESRGFEILSVKPLFVLMNSPTDLSGLNKLAFKTSWSLTKLPYKAGKLIGLGEVFGGAMGASMYLPELLLTRIFPRGPSTKILVARKK
ncbi:MAG TPA: class I SAM-dependent methyltransferase [Planctomycetota bacterium]|nr:class I SAM-dependent methyltransferase [Planctomycetota bacterium]